MIPRLLQGVARSLFLLGCSFLAIGGLAIYASYRCLRAAFSRENGMPVRDATFALMGAAMMLANALRQRAEWEEQRTAARSGWEEPAETDPVEDLERVESTPDN